jgi:hypothetical protein
VALVWRNVKIEGSILLAANRMKTVTNLIAPPDSYRPHFLNPTQNSPLSFAWLYQESRKRSSRSETASHNGVGHLQLPLGHDSNWSTLCLGQNHDTGEGKTQSFLIEFRLSARPDTVYARWERVQNPVRNWF